MMTTFRNRFGGVASVGFLALGVVAASGSCSSSSSTSSGTGGHAGGTGGVAGSTAATGGTTGASTGGAPGTGGGAGGATGTGGTGPATGSGGAGGGTVVDAGSGATLTVTSTAFNAGDTVPAIATCAGANMSPALAWAQAPAGTMSFAVSLTDLTNSTIHWVIWDIPATTLALPAGLPLTASLTTPAAVAGAKQAHHIPFFGATDNGYRGPCPGPALHNYQFEVQALDVATLPTVTTASTPPDVHTQILAHSLAVGDLVGTSTAMMSGQ